jgi:alkylated DNA repair dioxygenase AlkB
MRPRAGDTSSMIEGLFYLESFLGREEVTQLRHCLDVLPFYRDVFRGRELRRRYAQFGFRYGSTGRTLESAAQFPPFLAALAEKARRFSLACEAVNQCIITHYDAGSGIGWHTDASGFGDCIFGVSVGGLARLQFRRIGAEHKEIELAVRSGSLYIMNGASRWDFQHRVLPVKATRYALTFRHVRDLNAK